MVEQVSAWRDRDGKMHADKSDALLADARIELRSLLRNEGLVNDILNNRNRIYEALDPLVMNERITDASIEHNIELQDEGDTV